MNNQERPQMVPGDTGALFKTFSITGKKGMQMPDHYATYETVVVVHEGKAVLHINGNDISLSAGGSRVIPAGVPHSLDIQEDFKATAVMAMESEIKFN